MPFNFRLPGKRSQQYNVASKDLFIITIELLTSECIECTLLSTSTGQECLENVCQKIGIQQSEYFSLMFRSKKMVDQWVDLSKSVKKQLSKYAQEPRLYFRLQYFVPNFHFLSDDVSRYHYFYAMKNLVIDGRIACSRDDAILLASFSLQAEFGDYSPERHTVEYLNNYNLFPKSMVMNKIARDVLIECAINAYRNLQGVPPSVAEIYYISEAQRREGYGQEGFPARDLSTGQDVCLGVCIRGIFVVNTETNTLELFKWMDIANLMHQKKVFTIERFTDKYSKNYSTYDNDYANCIWQTCVEQHQYFMKGIQNAQQQQQQNDQMTSVTNPIAESIQIQLNSGGIAGVINNDQSSSSTTLLNPSTLYLHQQHQHHGSNNSVHKILPQQQQTTTDQTSDYLENNENNNQSFYETIGIASTSTSSLTNNNNNINNNNENVIKQPPITTTIAQIENNNNDNNNNNLEQFKQMSLNNEPIDLNQIQINCQPTLASMNQYNLKSGELSHNSNNDLNSNNFNTNNTTSTNKSISETPIYENQTNLNDLTYEQRKKLLPPYRMPPDYDTFLKHKYLMSNSMSQSLSSIPTKLQMNGINKMYSDYNMKSSNDNSNTINGQLITSHTQLINTSSSSTLSLCHPQQQQQSNHLNSNQSQQQQFYQSTANTYGNYMDLSNLAVDQSASALNVTNIPNHRCSLPPTTNDDVTNINVSTMIPTNQLTYQHQRLHSSGMYTSSSPDLNTLHPSVLMNNKQALFHTQPQQQTISSQTNLINSNVIAANNINLKSMINHHHLIPMQQEQKQQILIKKPPYFTSVPDLTFNKQYTRSAHQNYIDLFGPSEKKLSKTKNLFRLFGFSQNKTGSEPNLFNNIHNNNLAAATTYSPNSYLKRTKYSIEKLNDTRVNGNNNCTSDSQILQRPKTMSFVTISEKVDDSESVQQQQSTAVDSEANIQTRVGNHYINVDQQQQQVQPSHQNEQLRSADSAANNAAKKIANSRIIVFGKSFDDQDFTKEFELLPRMNPTAKFTTASLSENILKNRFRDILPYEENRVKLQPTKDNKHGYINASHVYMNIYGQTIKQHYIAAQGPLPNTTLDFWQMVFEQHINLIVMVTNFSESGSQKCYVYLPLSCEPNKNVLRFGDYEITCTYTTETLTYVISLLILSYNGQRRQITHLRYTDWNDHSIPGDLQSFLTFLSEMDAIYRQNNRDASIGLNRKRYYSSSLLNNNQSQLSSLLPPILVHCSAGAGRSGVMILCDALLKCLDYQHSEPIDVPKALIQLRFQRMISVQHCEQFRFVCQVLSQNLSNSRLI